MNGIGIAPSFQTVRGVSLAELKPVLTVIAAIGFDYAELRSTLLGVIIGGKLQPARLAALREAVADSPVKFTLHGSRVSTLVVGNLWDTSTPAQHASVRADLDLAAALGAEVLVYHSGLLRYPHGDDRAVAHGLRAEQDALRALGDEAGRRGVQIAVENLDPVASYIAHRAYGLRLDHLADQVSAIDHPCVGICLDVGHAFLAAHYLDFDYLAAIREIAPLVSHVHLSDNFGLVELSDNADPNDSLALGDGDLHLPPGWGSIPLEEVFATPFPRIPRVIAEVRAQFAEHFPGVLATARALTSHQRGNSDVRLSAIAP